MEGQPYWEALRLLLQGDAGIDTDDGHLPIGTTLSQSISMACANGM